MMPNCKRPLPLIMAISFVYVRDLGTMTSSSPDVATAVNISGSKQ